jgi:hypothetical protein
MSWTNGSSNAYIGKPRAREIEQQLAQLRWRRMQNERNIRNYLETTKVMKQKDTILGLTIDQSAERMQWLDSIVRDELTRPLVLSDEELHKVQSEESKMKKRLHKYANQQYHNLKKLQSEVAQREPRTEDGKQIKEEQLILLQELETKLERNITEIEDKAPYIQVKQVVDKFY